MKSMRSRFAQTNRHRGERMDGRRLGVFRWISRKWTLAAICLAAFVPLGSQGIASAAATYCNDDHKINFAGVNWDSGEFITAVVREILERGFDCKTDLIPGNTVTLEQAVANNDVQILAEEWVSRSDVWKQAAEKGQVRAVGHPFIDATEGWFVPDYVVNGDPARNIRAQAPELQSVAQLSEPRYRALFADAEQPDHGRFLNCPSGWTCEAVNSAKLKAYRLDRFFVDFRPGTGPGMDAAITSAYQQGLPILFYYWAPSSIAGKLKLTRLEEPPYSPVCWNDLTNRNGDHLQGCAAPPADVAYGLSETFAKEAPEIVHVLEKATFSSRDLNANLSDRVEAHRAAKDQALAFLRGRPEIWQSWVPPAIAAKIADSLSGPDDRPVVASFPFAGTLSIRLPVNAAVAALVDHHGAFFRRISQGALNAIVALDRLLAATPWWGLIGFLCGMAWLGSKSVGLSLLVGCLLAVIGLLGLWDLMLQTLTLMLFASLLSLGIGLFTGIWVAKSRMAKAIVVPILDIMQTMPSFVYLIPAVMLLGLGKVPAILAAVIYSLPPMIRLTALGIEQIDLEIKEAATAFGLAPLQMLWSVELPLARPTIMAGVNQTVMLSLSMVVVASMIGARGLGEQVLNGIQSLDVGLGLEAGLAIVILAFVLDRTTQGFAARSRNGKH
jgi:ABC-type proline/glycine betaine transport system permease subunit/ABC-type proline/glycine betaine transport system substrate-binding protein